MAGLYAITPDCADGEILLAKVRAALQFAHLGGWAALQYRNKAAAPAQRAVEARALSALCRARGVPFIVNDDVELALASGADGVHLGRDDGALGAARRRLGDRLLGASCYDRLDVARTALAAGADYVAFGSVYPSTTKPGAVRAPLGLFTAARALGAPIVAIGGITLERAGEILRAGADCLAVISDLFDAPDIAARARAYANLFAAQASLSA
ncbi:MAG TPA: thiamine phosphate synthase [Burkholderiales bacterium]|nr:thiamine phosphate synthase [Burkholderiales bacterium]